MKKVIFLSLVFALSATVAGAQTIETQRTGEDAEVYNKVEDNRVTSIQLFNETESEANITSTATSGENRIANFAGGSSYRHGGYGYGYGGHGGGGDQQIKDALVGAGPAVSTVEVVQNFGGINYEDYGDDCGCGGVLTEDTHEDATVKNKLELNSVFALEAENKQESELNVDGVAESGYNKVVNKRRGRGFGDQQIKRAEVRTDLSDQSTFVSQTMGVIAAIFGS